MICYFEEFIVLLNSLGQKQNRGWHLVKSSNTSTANEQVDAFHYKVLDGWRLKVQQIDFFHKDYCRFSPDILIKILGVSKVSAI